MFVIAELILIINIVRAFFHVISLILGSDPVNRNNIVSHAKNMLNIPAAFENVACQNSIRTVTFKILFGKLE